MRTRLRSARRSRAGFSIIEILVGSMIVAIIMGAGTMVSLTAAGTHNLAAVQSHVQDLSQRACTRVATELANAGRDSLFPNPDPVEADDLLYQSIVGVDAGVAQWSTPSRVAFAYDTGEVDDGADNNGNGLIDEGQLVLTLDDGGANERSVVLCHAVRELLEGELPNGVDDNGNGLVDEPGFSVQRTGDLLIVRLTLERTGPNGLVTSTAETAVQLRN